MTRKSKAQPYCRMCGKAIGKFTETVFIRLLSEHNRLAGGIPGTIFLPAEELPLTREDCQKLTKATVISVRFSTTYRDGEPVGREVWSFNTWDGETYVDQFFCNGTCCKRFAYMMAKTFPNSASKAYVEAIRARDGIPMRNMHDLDKLMRGD